ncbi:MAG: 50S ribosomal protein L1 [bacterium]
MALGSKKYRERQKLLPQKDMYALEEVFGTLKVVCEKVPMKFDETVEASVRLGIDPRKAEQQVRGSFVLPHGTGKTPRVLVFAVGEKVREAEEAGADYAGGEELAEKVQGGWLDFDVVIATKETMGFVGKLGKILGPRGLMPNPKSGTVTMQVAETVKEFKSGKVEYRNDSYGIIHVPIGKISFDEGKLRENFMALYQTLMRAKPASARGQYIKSIAISSTMGPGLKVQIGALTK